MFNNQIIKLKEGQFVTGRKKLSLETGISESKIERILKLFESEQQIKQQTNNRNRIITILRWSQYQVIGQLNEQQVDSKQTTGEQLVDTNNNVENDNNDKNDKKKEAEIVYPFNSENFLKAWDVWKKYKKEQHRFVYRTALSEQAALKKIGNLANDETEAIAILHEAMANGYKGFFELKNNVNGKHRKIDFGKLLDDLQEGPIEKY